MWNLPGPGIEPMSPTLAGGFSSTEPPAKSSNYVLYLLPTKLWISFGQGSKLCLVICLPREVPVSEKKILIHSWLCVNTCCCSTVGRCLFTIPETETSCSTGFEWALYYLGIGEITGITVPSIFITPTTTTTYGVHCAQDFKTHRISVSQYGARWLLSYPF